jgi:hypothetical protein
MPRFISGLLVSACFLGCGDASESARGIESRTDVVAETAQRIYGAPSTYWTGSPPFVNVCWEPASFDNTAFAQVRAWVEDAVRSNWNRYARLNLVDVAGNTTWKACTPGQPGIHAWVRHSPPEQCGGSNTGTGTNHNGVTNGIGFPDCDPSSPCGPLPGVSQEQCVKRIALHESGHGIGFYHETERPGEDLPDCNPGNFPGEIPGGQKYGAYNENSVMSECDQAVATATEINAMDIAALQRAYGRRIGGSLVSASGRCVASFGNAIDEQPFMWDCDEAQDDQEWDFTFATGTFNMRHSNLCLAGRGTSTADLVACNGADPQQQWSFQNTYLVAYGQCMDLNGANTNGGGVQTWECGAMGGANQRWFITRAAIPEIKFGSPSSTSCLTVPTSGTGQLTVTPCDGSTHQKFRMANSDGQIVSDAFPSLCLDIQSELDSSYMSGFGGPRNGQMVQLHACAAGQFNQKWNFSGEIYNTHWNGCLSRTAATTQGSKLFVGPCDGSMEQRYDYYPL